MDDAGTTRDETISYLTLVKIRDYFVWPASPGPHLLAWPASPGPHLRPASPAIAERYAVLRAAASGGIFRNPLEDSAPTKASDRKEFEGLLYIIPVLFQSAEVIDRVAILGQPGTTTVLRIQYELQAHLFAEALDLPFTTVSPKKVMV